MNLDESFTTYLKTFHGAYKKELEKLPFHLNVIDELHASENAHSRILAKILQYQQKKDFPFLKSFLDNFVSGKHDLTDPVIAFNQENIDLLIEDKNGDFACIIENKINWAVDQWKQIERYIDLVKKHGKMNIFAIYLTSDGNKEISCDSLTDSATTALDYKNKDDTGRFIPLNYRDHILPWLKEQVLNNCPYKETRMITAVTQYIDHLEGLFNIREDKKVMSIALKDLICNCFEINRKTVEGKDYERVADLKKTLAVFQAELENVKQDMLSRNPWIQPPKERAAWLAQDFCKSLKEASDDKIRPFSDAWVYKENITVLDKWMYHGYVFAIDFKFNNLLKVDASFFSRNAVDKQFLDNFQKQFSKAFEENEWDFVGNISGKCPLKYVKEYDEISQNNYEKFKDDVFYLLEALIKALENKC